jgi:hypothetical protein
MLEHVRNEVLKNQVHDIARGPARQIERLETCEYWSVFNPETSHEYALVTILGDNLPPCLDKLEEGNELSSLGAGTVCLERSKHGREPLRYDPSQQAVWRQREYCQKA